MVSAWAAEPVFTVHLTTVGTHLRPPLREPKIHLNVSRNRRADPVEVATREIAIERGLDTSAAIIHARIRAETVKLVRGACAIGEKNSWLPKICSVSTGNVPIGGRDCGPSVLEGQRDDRVR